jgi:hypothetical protein
VTSRHTCPACGHKWDSKRTRGRPTTAFYTVDGQTLHIDQWASILGVTAEGIRERMRRRGESFEVVMRHFDKAPRKPGKPPETPIITTGKYGWRAKQ